MGAYLNQHHPILKLLEHNTFSGLDHNSKGQSNSKLPNARFLQMFHSDPEIKQTWDNIDQISVEIEDSSLVFQKTMMPSPQTLYVYPSHRDRPQGG